MTVTCLLGVCWNVIHARGACILITLPTEHSMQQTLQSELSIERNIGSKVDAEVGKSAPIELTGSLLKLVSGGSTVELPRGTW